MDTTLPTPEIPTPDDTAINPYIAGAPVVESRMFFGREDIFEWIEKSLGGQYADHILVVHGQRRVGKTSVLKQLGNRLPKKYVPIFFDLQGRTHTTLDRFLWWLAREIARVLKQERGIDVPLPEKDAFTSDPDYFENHFLPELLPALKGSVMLLTFDEFDNLEEEEIKEALARPLVDYLRRVMGTQGLNFIYSIGSSGRKLENMQASYTEFFKTALYRKISFLSKDQAAKLITEPVKGVLEYEKGAIDLIYQIAFGHPYFTQLMCHELFALHQRIGRKKIREEDVNSILDDVVERGTVNLKFVWDEANDLEKWTLAGLAHMEGKPDMGNLMDFMHKQRVRFVDPELNAALLHLREKDVINSDNRFVIQLLKLWLSKNRPLEQVRDELTEVNPIANRYIEIGMEFKDTRQYERAIESFQEALGVDADNIQAQTSIALVYLNQKAYDKAVVEFEKALKMDDEDVASRSGLCEAHLALGDLSLSKGRTKDAITSYQRVLAINAEHTEARQRMAEIYKQRAEKALTDGNDEEALSAYADALKFTPEDPVLASRVAQVQEEKRAKVIKSLSAKAEKEVAARNWKQALAYYDDALKLSPDNTDLLTTIEQVKEKQKAAQLEVIRTRANQAMQTSKWEEAIGIFNEYLALEPEDKAVRKKIAEAQERLRQSRLDALRTKAKSLTKAEKWDDALIIWKQYLDLNPEDKKDASKEIEKVEKAQATSKVYVEAQTAFTKKNYGRAIELLKGIVVDNENYKDASAMLAQAIELRRTAPKWWQHKWLWGTAGGLALAGLAFVVIRLLMLPPLIPSNPTQSLIGGATQGPSPVPTTLPTPTATAIPLAWSRLNSGKTFARDTITVFVIDPIDPGVMYAGTENAGLYKSIDGGMTWFPSYTGIARAWIQSLVIDPTNHNVLYTGVSLGGAYKSTDGGASWYPIEALSDAGGWEHVSIITMDPGDHNHLYYTQSNTLFSSTDGGENWKTIQFQCPNPIVALAVNPKDSNTLYAGGQQGDMGCEGGLYTSRDGGITWEPTSVVGNMVFHALAIDPLEGTHLYTSTDSFTYSSNDGGVTWTTYDLPNCTYFAIEPEDPNIAFCNYDGAFYKTTNGGVSWSPAQQFPDSAFYAAFSPNQTNTMVTAGKGVFFSQDGGQTWVEHSNGLGAVSLDLKLDPANMDGLFVEDQNCNVYQSPDRGKSWQNFIGPGCDLAIDPETKVYYMMSDTAILTSSDGGTSWRSTAISLPQEMPYNNSSFSFDPFKSRLFIIYPRDSPPYIFYSDNQGVTWLPVEGMRDIHDGRLFFTRQDPETVYLIGDSDFSQSSDGGKTWSDCSQGLSMSARSISRLVIDPRDSNSIYLATRGQGILASRDGCKSWNPKNNGLGNLSVNTTAIDPNQPDTMYAGTDNGVYVSFDSGEHWGEISDGLLGATVVYSIIVDDQSNVYAGTPYGIFKLEGE